MKLLIVEDTKKFSEVIKRYCEKAGFDYRHVDSSWIDKKNELSQKEYQRRFGDDVGFEAAMAGRIMAKEAFWNERYIRNTKGLYPRLRGYASRLHQLIEQWKPDVITLNNGFTPISQVTLAKAIRFNIPVIFTEAPITPGATLLMDSIGPFFIPEQNWLDQNWLKCVSKPLTEVQHEQAQQFLDQWQQKRESKIAIQNDAGELAALDRFVSNDRRPTLLLGMQVVRDMSVVFNLPERYRQDYRAWVDDVINHIPSGWKLVIKRHPRCWYTPEIPVDRENDVLLIDAINIHDAIEKTDATIVLCSNVGLESLLMGLPTLIGGRPFYGGKGLTLDLFEHDMSVLPKLLDQALGVKVDCVKRRELIYHALLHYQFWPNENEKFSELVESTLQTGLSEELKASPSRPFLTCYPAQRKHYIAFLEQYNVLRDEGVSRRSALKKLFSQADFAQYRDCFSWREQARMTWKRRSRTLQQSLAKRRRRRIK